MLIVSLLIVSIYFLMNVGLVVVWLRNPLPTSPDGRGEKASSLPIGEGRGDRRFGGVGISVIIPVRNEAKNILFLLHDLEKQTYPKDRFEVIIADDDSSDDTLKIIQAFQKNTSIDLIINQLPLKNGNTSPKKRAIDSSIRLAKFELITTTDGDCRVGDKWLETIADFQEKTGAYLVSGAVTFLTSVSLATLKHRSRELVSDNSRELVPERSRRQQFINNIQIIEFASLIGTGACAMFAGKPNMCNGANLTYLKTVFYEVGGFAGNEQLASGDDEFLMHKVAAKYPEKVQFLKSQNVIVETQAHDSWRSFYNQRKRWASKWKHYNNWQTTALAVFIFSANFVLLLALGFWLSAFISTEWFCLLLFLKFSVEFVFLSLIVCFLRKKHLIWLIPFVQIIYPFYVTFFGIIAQGKNDYIWKGRKLS